MPLTEIDRTALRQTIQAKALEAPNARRLVESIVSNQEVIARLQLRIDTAEAPGSNEATQSAIVDMKAKNRALLANLEQQIPL